MNDSKESCNTHNGSFSAGSTFLEQVPRCNSPEYHEVGRIGIVVCLLRRNKKKNTIDEPIGFGSNITAELCTCALRTALVDPHSLLGTYKQLYVLCDCFIAVKWTNSKSNPTRVKDIRKLLQRLQEHVQVVGVPGIEAANTAAQTGAEQIDLNKRSASGGKTRNPRKVARTVDQSLPISD